MVSEARFSRVSIAACITLQSWARGRIALRRKQHAINACISLQMWIRFRAAIRRAKMSIALRELSKQRELEAKRLELEMIQQKNRAEKFNGITFGKIIYAVLMFLLLKATIERSTDGQQSKKHSLLRRVGDIQSSNQVVNAVHKDSLFAPLTRATTQEQQKDRYTHKESTNTHEYDDKTSTSAHRFYALGDVATNISPFDYGDNSDVGWEIQPGRKSKVEKKNSLRFSQTSTGDSKKGLLGEMSEATGFSKSNDGTPGVDTDLKEERRKRVQFFRKKKQHVAPRNTRAKVASLVQGALYNIHI